MYFTKKCFKKYLFIFFSIFNFFCWFIFSHRPLLNHLKSTSLSISGTTTWPLGWSFKASSTYLIESIGPLIKSNQTSYEMLGFSPLLLFLSPSFKIRNERYRSILYIYYSIDPSIRSLAQKSPKLAQFWPIYSSPWNPMGLGGAGLQKSKH